MENNFNGLMKFIQEEVKKLHQITILKEEKEKIEKSLMLIKENGLIKHYKITYDQPAKSPNKKEMKKDVIWLNKPTEIQGKNFDKEIRELNLGDNQEVIPVKH